MASTRFISVPSALIGTLLALAPAPALAAADPVAAPAEEPAPAAAPVATTPTAATSTAATTGPAVAEPTPSSPEPEPSQASDDFASEAPTDADLPLGATTPAYGMGVREVSVDGRNGESYRLSPRRWEEHVEENPRLGRLQRRQRLIIPGIALAAQGALWLTISAAVEVDRNHNGNRERHLPALSATFQWVIPAAIATTGVAMLLSGRAARREIEGAQEKFYIAPTASRDSGGMVMGGRF